MLDDTVGVGDGGAIVGAIAVAVVVDDDDDSIERCRCLNSSHLSMIARGYGWICVAQSRHMHWYMCFELFAV